MRSGKGAPAKASEAIMPGNIALEAVSKANMLEQASIIVYQTNLFAEALWGHLSAAERIRTTFGCGSCCRNKCC